jgi:hypothetical protein
VFFDSVYVKKQEVFLNTVLNADQVDNDIINQTLNPSKIKANEKVLNPTTHATNAGNDFKSKGKEERGIWSKLKGLWS